MDTTVIRRVRPVVALVAVALVVALVFIAMGRSASAQPWPAFEGTYVEQTLGYGRDGWRLRATTWTTRYRGLRDWTTEVVSSDDGIEVGHRVSQRGDEFIRERPPPPGAGRPGGPPPGGPITITQNVGDQMMAPKQWLQPLKYNLAALRGRPDVRPGPRGGLVVQETSRFSCGGGPPGVPLPPYCPAAGAEVEQVDTIEVNVNGIPVVFQSVVGDTVIATGELAITR